MTRLTAKQGTVRARRSPRANRARGKITNPPATRGMIEQRARELAVIAGRTPTQVTPTDRREAKRQLLGVAHPGAGVGEEMPWTESTWGSPVTSTGRRVRKVRPRDDQVTKELVEEGVGEAEHSQMLAARKSGK